jgi:hypothetical protein
METTCIEKHRYCNRNERAEWITRYRSSGLRPAQFAEQHGLKLGTLRNWIQKESHESSLGRETTGFQELLLPSVAATGPWAAEVQLPDGVVVRLGVVATPSWIASLLKTVRPSCSEPSMEPHFARAHSGKPRAASPGAWQRTPACGR